MSPREVYLADYPSVPYQEALNLQRQILSAKIEGTFPDVLILLEHPPTVVAPKCKPLRARIWAIFTLPSIGRRALSCWTM